MTVRLLEQVPATWRPWLRNFLIYILPVIVGEIIIGKLRGDIAIGHGVLPALAAWGLTGRIQTVPIGWTVSLIGDPALLGQVKGTWTAIWTLTAIGVGTGLVRILRHHHKARSKEPKRPQTIPWCQLCQKEVRPVRTEFPAGWFAMAIALVMSRWSVQFRLGAPEHLHTTALIPHFH